jgi:hypothetical protein
LRAFLFIAICLLSASCFDEGDCLIRSTTLIKVGLKDSTATANAKEVTFSSIHIPGRGVLYEDETTSAFAILADPVVDEIVYVFQYGNRSDTIVFGYSNQTRVLAPDCGAFLYQDHLEVKYSTFGINKVLVKNKQLLSSVPINIEILL